MDEGKFDRELQQLTSGLSTFEEWQFAYRKVVYKFGLEILGRFPDVLVGPMPGHKAGAQAGSGGGTKAGHSSGTGITSPQAHGKNTGPGPHPSAICKLGCLISELDSGPSPNGT